MIWFMSVLRKLQARTDGQKHCSHFLKQKKLMNCQFYITNTGNVFSKDINH